jgi:hypothetical protein
MISGSSSASFYLASDNATVDSAYIVSPISVDIPLLTTDSPSTLSADLNLVVDFSSYPL